MDNTQNKPGKKMILSMLRVIDRYSIDKDGDAGFSQGRNPLDSSFLLTSEYWNKRNHQRLAMIGQVNLNKGDQFIVGDCKDISASGMFVACYPDDSIQVNDFIHLIIKLTENEQVFRAKARVTRQEKNGYAVRFVTL